MSGHLPRLRIARDPPEVCSVPQLKIRAYQHNATAGALLTALAIERYRLAHGELPATLAELVPAYLDDVLLDPFTGKPLIYQPDTPGAGAYTIYSVGDDGVDNGGTKTDVDGREYAPGTDIVLVIQRAR